MIAGYQTIHIRGFNLGSSRNALKYIEIKSKRCTSVIYYNSTDIACVVGDQELLSSPITGYCISVATTAGAFYGNMSRVMAVARKAAGYRKPIVYDVTVKDEGFMPGSVVVDSRRRRLFWSNSASKSIQSSATNGSNLHVVASGLPHVLGLALHSFGHLYFTEASSGTLRRCVVTEVSDSPPGEPVGVYGDVEIVLRGLTEPRGVAIDEALETVFIAEAGTGKILSVPITKDETQAVQATVLVQVASKVRLERSQIVTSLVGLSTTH